MNRTYYIYGKHCALSAIFNPNRTIHKIYVTPNYNTTTLINLLKKRNHTNFLINKIQPISAKELELLLNTENNHQGIAVLTESLPQPSLNSFLNYLNKKDYATLVALDQVNDPHNIGAILRSAAAFDIDAIIIPKHNTPPTQTSSIAKVASSALETVPIITVTNLINSFKILKKHNFWCIGLDNNANTKDISSIHHYDKVLLVLGSEGKGLRSLTKTYCDLSVRIPFNNKKIESLNLSNAAAISFYIRYIKTLC